MLKTYYVRGLEDKAKGQPKRNPEKSTNKSSIFFNIPYLSRSSTSALGKSSSDLKFES